MKARFSKSLWVTSLAVVTMLFVAGCGKKNDPIITPPPVATNPYGNQGGGYTPGGGGFVGGYGMFATVSANLYDQQGQTLPLQNLQLQYSDQYQSPANMVISLVGSGMLTVPTYQGQQQFQVYTEAPGTFQNGMLSIRLVSQMIQNGGNPYMYQPPTRVTLDIRNAQVVQGQLRNAYGGWSQTQIFGNILGTQAVFYLPQY